MKPTYPHDCAQCVFLGTVLGQYAAEVYDLYICEKPDPGRWTVVARYGVGSEYLSATDWGVKGVQGLHQIATTAGNPTAIRIGALLGIEYLTERARSAPALCEVCLSPVREGMRYCSGLRGCFWKGAGLAS